MVLRKGIRKIKQGMKMYNNQLSVLRTELRSCKRKAAEQSKQLAEQQNMLAEHQKQTLEYANRLDENDKKNEEMARKFSTLLQVRRQQFPHTDCSQILIPILFQELNKCKTELQFRRSKSPAIPSVCSSCNQKIAPVLPPEDLQALLDPENIIINDRGDANAAVVADEEDAADVNGGVEVGSMVDKQFASPDESTTAKLLAVNSAAKNLKRKYAAANMDAECAASSNAIASNVTPSNVNITTTPTTQTATATSSSSSSGNANNGGYSTKLFYGNNNHQQRSGVIVSPVSMKLSIGSNGNGIGNRLTVEESPMLAVPPVGVSDIADQVESKKARRVQKANRCVNSAHGKRSK